MNTATVTWITYNNYGTVLQAYALQKFIEALGHHNEILSDDIILKRFGGEKTKADNTIRKKPIAEGKNDKLKRLLKNPRRIGRVMAAHFDRSFYVFPYYGAQDRFEEFKKEELSIRYGISNEFLPDLNQDYHAFICGSDQIWSVFDGVFNPYYYLDFANRRKISYAPSMGTDKLPEERKESIAALLSDFSSLSVREKISADQLSAICGKKVTWACDPTFLFDRSFWGSFSSQPRSVRSDYLLCYFLENNAWYFEYAKALAKKLHLRIRLIANKWDFLSNENVICDAVGPKEFVGLVQNAAYVLTDSYHGSIFSLIFEKDFLYLKRFSEDDPRSQNIRVESLFSYLDTMNRVLSAEGPLPDELKIQNYPEIKARLDEYIERSKAFLAESLDG